MPIEPVEACKSCLAFSFVSKKSEFLLEAKNTASQPGYRIIINSQFCKAHTQIVRIVAVAYENIHRVARTSVMKSSLQHTAAAAWGRVGRG